MFPTPCFRSATSEIMVKGAGGGQRVKRKLCIVHFVVFAVLRGVVGVKRTDGV